MSEKPISPLRRRMIEDMTVHNFVEKTRNSVADFCALANTPSASPAYSRHGMVIAGSKAGGPVERQQSAATSIFAAALYGASLEISMFPNPMGNSFERSVGIAMGSSRSPLKAAKQTGSRFRIAQATSMPTKTGIGDAVLGPLKS